MSGIEQVGPKAVTTATGDTRYANITGDNFTGAVSVEMASNAIARLKSTDNTFATYYITNASNVDKGYFSYNFSTDTLTTAVGGSGVMNLSPNGFGVAQYKSFYVPANSMTPRTTNGASATTTEHATNDIMIDSLDFDGTTSEGAQFTYMMPDDWDLGAVKMKFAFTTTSTGGNVIFLLAGGALTDSDAIDTALGTAAGAAMTPATANDINLSAASAAITIAGTPALGDLCIFEVTRDPATDTYAGDAQLVGVHIQYKTLGTVTAIW